MIGLIAGVKTTESLADGSKKHAPIFSPVALYKVPQACVTPFGVTVVGIAIGGGGRFVLLASL